MVSEKAATVNLYRLTTKLLGHYPPAGFVAVQCGDAFRY